MNYKETMNHIDTFVLDVDGVLTDGTVHVTPSGEMLREMHIRDGFAMKAALESGYRICVISGGSNEGVRIRLRNLGITDIHLGVPDKVQTFKEYCFDYQVDPKNSGHSYIESHKELMNQLRGTLKTDLLSQNFQYILFGDSQMAAEPALPAQDKRHVKHDSQRKH